ncbi:MAG: iron-only hydrogenase system regulator [Mycoplasmataceae bacterium]|nr:iron-only hydrogenase system regulator [Mycoplasmataceae bacterium]
MENQRIALLGIVVEDTNMVNQVNELLHQYRQGIVGRMGVPHRTRDLCIISVVLEADQDTISALSGKLGAIKGISSKVLYAK